MRTPLFLSVVAAGCAMCVMATAASAPDAAASAPGKKASPGPSKTPPGPLPCDSGEPRDESGSCPVIDESDAKRGFVLFSGALPSGKASAPLAASAAPQSAPLLQRTKVASIDRAAGSVAAGQASSLVITFRSGSAQVAVAERAMTLAFAAYLNGPERAGQTFLLEGHADSTGAPEKNRRMARRRADAVKALLVAEGVESSRLRTVGFGAERLADQAHPRAEANRSVTVRKLD